MALTQPKLDALEARLAGLSTPEGGAWATEARGTALSRLRAMGLPHARDEYWKYTRPDALTAAAPKPAAVFDAQETPVFDGFDRLKLVFVDGVFDPAQSDPLDMSGIRIERLAEAAGHDIHWAKDLYGALETRGQSPVERPLAALNTALCR